MNPLSRIIAGALVMLTGSLAIWFVYNSETVTYHLPKAPFHSVLSLVILATLVIQMLKTTDSIWNEKEGK